MQGKAKKGGARNRNAATGQRGGQFSGSVNQNKRRNVVANLNNNKRNKGGPRLSLNVKRRPNYRPSQKFPAAGQRLARNLVKRAMLNNRREKIAARRSNQPNRSMLAMDRVAMPNKTVQLQRQVQRLQGAVRVLTGALQSQQQRPAFSANRSIRPRVNNNIRNRVGWNTANRNLVRRSNQSLDFNPAPPVRRNFNVKGRGNATFFNNNNNVQSMGSMQSDFVSREQTRQRKMMADLLALAQSRSIGQNRRPQQQQQRFLNNNVFISPISRRNFSSGQNNSFPSSSRAGNRNVAFPTGRFPNNRNANRLNNGQSFGRQQQGQKRFGAGPKQIMNRQNYRNRGSNNFLMRN